MIFLYFYGIQNYLIGLISWLQSLFSESSWFSKPDWPVDLLRTKIIRVEGMSIFPIPIFRYRYSFLFRLIFLSICRNYLQCIKQARVVNVASNLVQLLHQTIIQRINNWYRHTSAIVNSCSLYYGVVYCSSGQWDGRWPTPHPLPKIPNLRAYMLWMSGQRWSLTIKVDSCFLLFKKMSIKNIDEKKNIDKCIRQL